MTETRNDTSDFAGRINALIDALECRICDSGSAYEAVCRLRYAAYLAEGAIDPDERRTLSDDFDHSPNALVFGIHLGGILAASIRIHLVSQRDPASPALAAFPDHLQGVLLQGISFIDPSRFVVDAGMAKAWAGLHLCTLRLPFIAAGYLGAHVVTATVQREHEAFYRRVLNCSPVCAPRPYPTLLKPLGLMTVDYREQAPRVLARYPFFRLRGGAEEALFAKLAGRSRPFSTAMRNDLADASRGTSDRARLAKAAFTILVAGSTISTRFSCGHLLSLTVGAGEPWWSVP